MGRTLSDDYDKAYRELCALKAHNTAYSTTICERVIFIDSIRHLLVRGFLIWLYTQEENEGQ